MNNRLEAALEYARSGLLVFPAPRGTKMSYKSARWNDGRRWGATRDELEIRNDFCRWPNANVCIVTGKESGLFVIETDTMKGHNVDGRQTLMQLENKNEPLPPTRQARSPSGSVHYYFCYPKNGTVVRNDTGKRIGPGVDVRGDGGMVVAPPSERDDGNYIWINQLPVNVAPEWLLRMVCDYPNERIVRCNYDPVHPDLVAAAVALIPPESEWNDRNKIGMAIYAATDGADEGLAIWDAWLQRSGKYNARHTQARWRALHRCPPAEVTAGTLFHLARQQDRHWLQRFDQELVKQLNRGSGND